MKTVRELKELLATMPDDAVVVMSCDSEGNGFGPLCDVSLGAYDADTEWSGAYTSAEEMDETCGVQCVALWPVN